MIDVEVTELDNKTYVEVDKYDIKDKTYVLLINQDDPKDFTIRKLTVEGETIFYTGLDSNEEFDLALMYFVKRHSDLLKN